MATTPYRIAERVLGLVAGNFPGEERFIWNTFLPNITNLPAISGIYAVENRRNYFGDANLLTPMAPLAEHPDVFVGALTEGTYATKKQGARSMISREELADAQDGLSSMERHTNKVRRDIWHALEQQLDNLLLDATAAAALWPDSTLAALTADPVVGTQWNAAGADPISDLMAVAETIRGQSGEDADSLLLSWDVALWARTNTIVRGYAGLPAQGIASGGSQNLTNEQLKRVLNDVLFGGAGKVEVMGAVRNTANMGQTPVLADQATDTFWMGKLSQPQATINGGTVMMDPVAAARLTWADYVLDTEELDENRGVKVFADIQLSQQVIDSTLGYLTTDVLA